MLFKIIVAVTKNYEYVYIIDGGTFTDATDNSMDNLKEKALEFITYLW